MSQLEQSAELFFQTTKRGFEKISESLAKEIARSGVDKYIFVLFKNYPQSMVEPHLLGNQILWFDLEVGFWERLIVQLQDLEVPLYNVIAFLHKYCKIDGLSVYKNSEIINIEIREKVLKYFSDRPGLLRVHDLQREYLRKNGIDLPN